MNLFLAVLVVLCATAEREARYPAEWWKPVPRAEGATWEILPQDAGPGEVILSKRNELGLLSNLAATPFEFRGVKYGSLEGFWQSMKYPESVSDARAKVSWKLTRDEVAKLSGFEAKRAGDLANANLKRLGITWVSLDGKRLVYREQERGEFYRLIVEATREKVRQNPEVKRVLLATGDLALKPDHRQDSDAPPAWRYHEILMTIRQELEL